MSEAKAIDKAVICTAIPVVIDLLKSIENPRPFLALAVKALESANRVYCGGGLFGEAASDATEDDLEAVAGGQQMVAACQAACPNCGPESCGS